MNRIELLLDAENRKKMVEQNKRIIDICVAKSKYYMDGVRSWLIERGLLDE